MIRVYSVPHTGTTFLRGLLVDAGLDVEVAHFGKKAIKLDAPIVCPIRDPEKQYITWKTRETNVDCFESWRIFNHLYENHSLHIIPVDGEGRDVYLSILSDYLGKELKTDWTPLNSRPRKAIEVPDLSEIYNLPVVRRFYG